MTPGCARRTGRRPSRLLAILAHHKLRRRSTAPRFRRSYRWATIVCFKSWRDLIRAVRPLLILLLIQLAVSLSGVLSLSLTYYWGMRAVVLHIALVTGIMLATAMILGMALQLRWMRASRWAKRALLLFPAAFSYALVVLYVA